MTCEGDRKESRLYWVLSISSMLSSLRLSITLSSLQKASPGYFPSQRVMGPSVCQSEWASGRPGNQGKHYSACNCNGFLHDFCIWSLVWDLGYVCICLSVCESVCLCLCVCAHARVYPYLCVEARAEHHVSSPTVPHITFWDRVFHWSQSSPILQDLLDSKLQGSLCVCLPRVRLQMCTDNTAFFRVLEGLTWVLKLYI